MFFQCMLVLFFALNGQAATFQNVLKWPWAKAPQASLHSPPHAHEVPPAKTQTSPVELSPQKSTGLPNNMGSPKNEGPPSPANLSPEAALLAHQFLNSLLKKDWEALFALAAFPFWLEANAYASPQALREAWEGQLSKKPLEEYEIGGIEVLTLEQMKKRFGPPPERLHKLLFGRNTHRFAIVNVSGRAVVLLLQPPTGPTTTFKVVAFHD